MTTNITITKPMSGDVTQKALATSTASKPKLPGWLWFIALWCFGVASAVSLGFAFKLLMNATLFAVR
ncbi:hypothetical protein SAMN05443245_4120 [Paraburkholderia fungorum]|uniref:DUF2474 domain-containing protein n=1 Tax=Paraburkholderia fungorum TaxID=134537 RepID=A0A1H1HPT8_9BURK|nr:hypothetical protein [Paraburkholderia fungorum]SDR27086.1 hypothetical protein SAMN05443245_4120 [Paraburkholderia fungorum]